MVHGLLVLSYATTATPPFDYSRQILPGAAAGTCLSETPNEPPGSAPGATGLRGQVINTKYATSG